MYQCRCVNKFKTKNVSILYPPPGGGGGGGDFASNAHVQCAMNRKIISLVYIEKFI